MECRRRLVMRILSLAYRLSIDTDLDDLEWHNCLYFAFSPLNSIALLANYVTVVKDRPILSPSFSLPPLAITNPPCNALSLR